MKKDTKKHTIEDYKSDVTKQQVMADIEKVALSSKPIKPLVKRD
jgi:hypothetical protein